MKTIYFSLIILCTLLYYLWKVCTYIVYTRYQLGLGGEQYLKVYAESLCFDNDRVILQHAKGEIRAKKFEEIPSCDTSYSDYSY